MRGPAVLLYMTVILAAGCGKGPERGEPSAPNTIRIKSSAFEDGDPIPQKYCSDPEGENVSPPLSWSNVPDGARELALICDDPDAPVGIFVHWVVYKIPADSKGFQEGDPGEVVEGRNDFGQNGWGGPLPPEGDGEHRYRFKLYVLDVEIDLAEGATKDMLLKAMEDHVLAKGKITGAYERE